MRAARPVPFDNPPMRQRLMVSFGIVGLVLAFVGLFGHYHSPGSVYTLALASFSAYLGLGALVAAVLFVFVRTRAGWVGFAASVLVVLWFVALQVPAYVAESAPATGVDVVIMTSNLKVGGADPASVVAAVRSRHVDVLMIEELTPDAETALQHAGLDKLLPHSLTSPMSGASGTGLWSRTPLTSPVKNYAFGFSFITAQTRLHGQPVTLAAMHVFGPFPQSQFPRWHKDMQRYPAFLAALPGSTVLVGGDFNATTDDTQFRTILNEGYADAAQQAGAGFTPTWPADRWFPPMITIDHVLTRGAVARSVDSVEIPGSDHRALVARVRIPT